MDTLILILFWGFVFWCCWRLFIRKWINNRSTTKRAKAAYMAHQIPEEAYYEQAAHEISNDQIRPGLWAKAWSQAGGDNRKAEAIYIKLRVDVMRKEAAEKIHEFSERRGASYQAPPIEDDAAYDTRRNVYKAIISCPKCTQKLRVDAGKNLEIICAACRHIFVTRT